MYHALRRMSIVNLNKFPEKENSQFVQLFYQKGLTSVEDYGTIHNVRRARGLEARSGFRKNFSETEKKLLTKPRGRDTIRVFQGDEP